MNAKPKRLLRPRISIGGLLALITFVTVAIVSYQQWVAYRRTENARQWILNVFEMSEFDWLNIRSFNNFFGSHCMPDISDVEQIPTLMAGTLHLETVEQKTCCLKILAEAYSDNCLEALVQIALRSKDVEIQVIAIRLIALKRDADTLPRLDCFANSSDERLRAARLDCIGFTRVPTYEGADKESKPMMREVESEIDCLPRISTAPIFTNYGFRIQPYALKSNIPVQYRVELEKVMLANQSSPLERAAAARAIVAWPPVDYRLRYAEWGVWISSEGKLHLVDSIIDEIPEFVHRTNNDLESFVERLNLSSSNIITKPVIHLTANKPMAIDLDVSFNAGRPWFAYPRPDDFQLQTIAPRSWPPRDTLMQIAKPMAKMEPLQGENLKVSEGYPWMTPAHRQYYYATQSVLDISGLGLRWQSAIVSPTKLRWMQLPKVDQDPKFDWWEDLRDVECSWVSNLNESERFIYYDGPTLAKSPINFELSANQVLVTAQPIFNEVVSKAFERKADTPDPDVRHGFYVHVDENGVSGAHIELKDGQEFDLENIELSAGAAIQESMFEQLLEAGLNGQEANGLIKCWTPAFFESPGQRIVFLLHESEYDLMCPMNLRPAPTKLARVGLVLTEFPTN